MTVIRMHQLLGSVEVALSQLLGRAAAVCCDVEQKMIEWG